MALGDYYSDMKVQFKNLTLQRTVDKPSSDWTTSYGGSPIGLVDFKKLLEESE